LTDVLIAGGNPCIFLHEEGNGILVALSYWDAQYSPAGAGKCLFLRSSHPKYACNLACSDNEPLLELVHANFNKHFAGFKEIDERLMRRERATFSVKDLPEKNRLQLEVHTSTASIVASWDEFGVAEQVIDDLEGFGSQAGERFRVASVIVPAARATIAINGQDLPGRVSASYGKLKSSAFLAWAESWSRLP
jgi:hypothetical protein